MSTQAFAVSREVQEKITKTKVPRLPEPASETKVETADPDTDLVLWRGTTHSRLAKMVTRHSMSGEMDPNPDATPPSTEDVDSQVGTNQIGKQRVKLPEFTTSKTVAQGYGRGGVVIAVIVKKKYLAKASGSEFGWATSNDAPLGAFVWVLGEKLEGGVGKRLNAD